MIDGKDASIGGGDHFALNGGDQFVVGPESFVGDAGGSEDGDVGMDAIESFFAMWSHQHTNTIVDGASGDDGLDRANVAEQSCYR